jgi:hypothetical protein
MLRSKIIGNLLRCLANDLEAPDERTPKRFVGHKTFEGQSSALIQQVIRLRQSVAEVITRLEGHPGIPR